MGDLSIDLLEFSLYFLVGDFVRLDPEGLYKSLVELAFFMQDLCSNDE
jgi:hypothetical protein